MMSRWAEVMILCAFAGFRQRSRCPIGGQLAHHTAGLGIGKTIAVKVRFHCGTLSQYGSGPGVWSLSLPAAPPCPALPCPALPALRRGAETLQCLGVESNTSYPRGTEVILGVIRPG